MKYITLIIGLLVVGCGKSDKVNLLEEENKRLKAEANVKHLEEKLKGAEEATPTAKPVNELTAEEKKVVGSYEAKIDSSRTGNWEGLFNGATFKFVFLENGNGEVYVDGIKGGGGDITWKIVGKEVHFGIEKGADRRDGWVQGEWLVFKIESNGDLTNTRNWYGGKQEKQEKPIRLKKIK